MPGRQLRPVPPRPNGSSTAAQRKVQLRAELEQYVAEVREKEARLIALSQTERKRAQDENADGIAYECRQLQRLLNQLTDDLDVEEVGINFLDTRRDTKRVQHKTEDLDEVNALRAFASDDTTMETTSVADYAAAPPQPPLYSSTCIRECADSMKISSGKVFESIRTLAKLVRDNPQWWNSPIIVRRLKTHAIRANYHARKIGGWSDMARSHIFVSSSVANRTCNDYTKELQDLKSHQSMIDLRNKNIVSQKTQIDTEAAQLNHELFLLQQQRAELVPRLIDAASELTGIHVANPQHAQAVLLLGKLLPLAQLGTSVQLSLRAFAPVCAPVAAERIAVGNSSDTTEVSESIELEPGTAEIDTDAAVDPELQPASD